MTSPANTRSYEHAIVPAISTSTPPTAAVGEAGHAPGHQRSEALPIVFIAGCGRSGTSYLRTLVDAHPDVFIPSESLFLADYLKHGHLLPYRLLHWLFWHEPQLLCWFDAAPAARPSPAELFAYASETIARREGARVWGQKTPRFVRDMSLFDAAWPQLRWILIYRDPRAVAASMLASRQHTFSVRTACTRWLRDNEHVKQLLLEPRSNVLLVKYEDMVADLQHTMDRVFVHIGVSPEPTALLLSRAKPVFFSRSRFSNNTVRDGPAPTAAAIHAWRSQLPTSAVRYIEERCCDTMQALGYTRETPPGGAKANRFARIRDFLIVKEYLLKWPEYLTHTLLRKSLMVGFRLLRRCTNWPRT